MPRWDTTSGDTAFFTSSPKLSVAWINRLLELLRYFGLLELKDMRLFRVMKVKNALKDDLLDSMTDYSVHSGSYGFQYTHIAAKGSYTYCWFRFRENGMVVICVEKLFILSPLSCPVYILIRLYFLYYYYIWPIQIISDWCLVITIFLIEYCIIEVIIIGLLEL